MSRSATALALMTAAALTAQSVPTTINYQGRLTDNTPAQNPVNATVPMKFVIYDASIAGANLWQEPVAGGTNVLVVNGVFNVALGGNGVAIPSSVFTGANSTRYLEITVNPGPSQEILTPRQLITASGYANLAQNANNAVAAVTATTATTANDSSGLGGVASGGWQKALTPPACPASQFYTGITQAGAAACASVPPVAIANCPAGMTRIDLTFSTLCYNGGITANWDTAQAFCDGNFRASICTLTQWRAAVCYAGAPNPGRSWLSDVTGASTFATIQGCTGDSVNTAVYSTVLKGPCCAEWMKY